MQFLSSTNHHKHNNLYLYPHFACDGDPPSPNEMPAVLAPLWALAPERCRIPPVLKKTTTTTPHLKDLGP